MRKTIILTTWLCCLSGALFPQSQAHSDLYSLAGEARQSLARAIAFYRTLAIEGGYVYHYTLDGKEKWGEGRTDDRTIEVQPPGTPAVGMSFLRAYRAAGDQDFLQAAEEAAGALIRGQNQTGGWDHKIYFDKPTGKTVSFDDNQTQSAMSFLMALDQEIDKPELTASIEKALDMLLTAQLDNGGWPHMYPARGNYHDYATFNDQGINDCIRVMIEADRLYDNEAYTESLRKVGRFMMIAQLPPPQPGWAQQYNEYLQPAWARSFEPPSVCPAATLHNLNSIMDLYQHTGRGEYLEAIPDAIRWLKASQLPNGKWGRFLEIGTNKPLYYDRGRIRVDSLEQLSLERRTGYAYETDLTEALAAVEKRYQHLLTEEEGREVEERDIAESQSVDLEKLASQVRAIIQAQDVQGRWVVRQDRFRQEVSGRRWNGEYRVEDRISSRLFNDNVGVICAFLEAVEKQ